MKKNYFLMMLTAASLVLGVTSCNNDDDGVNGVDNVTKGEPTGIELTISAPRVPGTYAPDLNATAAEFEMKTVNVLIYEKTGTGAYILEQNVSLNRSDFDVTVANSDTYTMKDASKISSTTGDKKIFVAMNYTGGTLPSTVGDDVTALASVVRTLTAADELTLAANGFAMFSPEGTDATLVAETTPGTTPAANKLTVKVKRLVAKITVQENIARTGGDIISQGGKLTNLQFAIANANKTIYPLQKRVGTAPSIVVQDANWASFAAGDFFGIGSYALTSTDYQAIDADGTPVTSLKTAYAPENTAQTYDANGDNLTYISVRAQYAPGFFVDAAGVTKGPNAAAAKSFWTVMATDGTIMYFDAEADADTYVGANQGTVKSAEYVDGLCYFRAYINKNGQADGNIAGSVAAKFDVLRNNYYKANISSIKAPGQPTDKGKVTETTSLTVDVQVEAWHAVTENYDL